MTSIGKGPSLALLSAVLFGASTPFAKALLGNVEPTLLAAILYLGSGVGLALLRVLRIFRSSSRNPTEQLGLKGATLLSGAIVFGGITGPILLMTGLSLTPASSASLLLNLEGVFTALLAWFVFHENVDRRIALGMASIVAGALVLSWQGGFALSGILGPSLIVAASLAWAIDNNLTRMVALTDPVQIAMLKGLIAGSINLMIAVALGSMLPTPAVVISAGILGFAGYGLSLVLFVLALRELGTARTGAYYSTAPFMGAVLAVLLLGEPLTVQLCLAGILMGLGVWLHLTERHEHEHEHAPVAHTHEHVHDEHHQHNHAAGDPIGEPHSHRHAHIRLRHRHVHYPDAHHQHRH
jgi:drug/metabolite transporter (DMT)-like permease